MGCTLLSLKTGFPSDVSVLGGSLYSFYLKCFIQLIKYTNKLFKKNKII